MPWNERTPDPWEGVQVPTGASDLFGRLVPDSGPHDLFRARDASGRRVLFLVHDPADIRGVSLPRMAGVEMSCRERTDDGRGVLALHLVSDENAYIFGRLCEDVIDTVRSSEDGAAAVRAFALRTWRWHDLLKGSRRAVLGPEGQLGLIGELHTLLHMLTPRIGVGPAVAAWGGASGAPKDFELPAVCIECKARGASARAVIRVTSEHQLEDVPGSALALLVHTFATSDAIPPGGFDLHEIVCSVRSAAEADDPSTLNRLDAKLDAAGYEPGHEYDVRVAHRAVVAYSVQGDFPRIVPGFYHEGPSSVSYELPLSALEPFRMSMDDLVRLATRDEVR
jgi:hypothetical protein